MRKILLLLSLASVFQLTAQIRTDVGVNLTPLLLNSLDVQAEWQLQPTFSLVAQTGIRYQTQEPDQPVTISPLSEYMQPRNVGGFVSLGGRFFNREVNEYQYPFIQLNLVGSYYDEELLNLDDDGNFYRSATRGFRVGVSSTIGFVIRVTNRASLDLAVQVGYTPPRDDIHIYYIPGMGYTTYGIDAISVKGAHVNPMFVFKYNIFQTPREKMYNME